MVRCRHSPAIPITPSSEMNRPVKSAVKKSFTSASDTLSLMAVARQTTSSDSASADPTRAANVRVVRSLSSSARSRALIRRPR